MTPLSATILVLVSFIVGSAIGHYVGWHQRAKNLPTPTVDQVAAYMDGVVNNEHRQALIRRNEELLRISGRTGLPYENTGPPAKISKMRLAVRRRRL